MSLDGGSEIDVHPLDEIEEGLDGSVVVAVDRFKEGFFEGLRVKDGNEGRKGLTKKRVEGDRERLTESFCEGP